MYPDFQYLLQGLLGTPMPEWLGIFKTFGFFVAMSFLLAAWTLTLELKRKERQGLLLPQIKTTTVGKPATTADLIWTFIIGFILGFKVGGIFGHTAEVAPDPMGYLFSPAGNWWVGLLAGALMAYSRYAEKKKQALPEPKQVRQTIWPHQRVGEMVMLAAVGGIAGAKIFNAFETWEDFIANPIESLLSSSGLTFYGGLIVAATVLYYYSRKINIPFRHLCDAVAPGLMIAYGFGRLGCHFAGDGDWGIFNSAYISQANTALALTGPEAFMPALHQHTSYLANLANEFGGVQHIPHLYAPAPSWMPDWLYAMNFSYNVNNDGVPIPGCTGNYCAMLPVGVFPTSAWEAMACVILFGILWAIRKRINFGLHLFGIYLIMNGLERFLVEKVRVNFKYDWGFIHPTQAEIISAVLVIGGICILLFYRKKNTPIRNNPVPDARLN